MTVSLRPMTTGDIELGMRLKAQAGWNQTSADWLRFLELEPQGCFVAEWAGRPVATTTTCTFGAVGWIAMVLVDESFRHRGIATRLVEHAMEYLDRRSVTTVRLDATKYGRPVYQRLGFIAEYDLARFQGIARPGTQRMELLPPCPEHLDDLAELDRRATATLRRRLLERLMGEHPRGIRLATRGDTVVGHTMLRPGANATQIGPVAATSASAGRALCDWAMAQCAGQPVFVDIPLRNDAAIGWASARGLVEQRRFSRMFRGQPIQEDVTLAWAGSGPEKG